MTDLTDRMDRLEQAVHSLSTESFTLAVLVVCLMTLIEETDEIPDGAMEQVFDSAEASLTGTALSGRAPICIDGLKILDVLKTEMRRALSDRDAPDPVADLLAGTNR